MKSNRQSFIVFISFVLIHLPIGAQELFTDDEFANVQEVETRLPDATSQNIPNTLVKRNKSGSFSANNITANLHGLANSAKTFTQALTGDVTGGQSSTVVANVGGKSAAEIATSVAPTQAASVSFVANTLVKRGSAATEFHRLNVGHLGQYFVPHVASGSPFSGGGIAGANCIAMSNNGKFVAVANTTASTISVFSMNLESGALSPNLASPFVGIDLDTPQYPVFFMNSAFLAVTCLGDAPGVVVFSVDPSNGDLAEVGFYSIPGIPQEIMVSPDGKWLAVGNSAGSVSMYSVNGTTGVLTEVAGSPFSAPISFAPDFSPDAKFLAVTNPPAETVTVYAIDQMTGALTEIESSPFTTSQLPRGVEKTSMLRLPPLQGFVRYSPQGNFLAVSNLTQNTVAFFGVNMESGELTSLDNSVFVDNPFNVEFSKNNLHLVVAERGALLHGKIRFFAIAQDSGIVSSIASIDVGDVPTCTRYYPNDAYLATLIPANNKIAVVTTLQLIDIKGSVALEGDLVMNPTNLYRGSIRVGGQPFLHSSGEGNTFLGSQSGNYFLTGENNVAVGALAMQHMTTASNNVAIGLEAGDNLETGNNNIYITAAAGSASESDAIRIGTDATSCYISGIDGATSASGVPVLVNASGQLGTVTSSEKYKKNINNVSSCVVDGLARIRTVEFQYNEELDPLGIKQFGFLAEEVAQICPDLVVFKNGKPETIRYHLFIPLLVSAYQELFASQQAQQRKIDELESNFKKLEKLNANVDQKA